MEQLYIGIDMGGTKCAVVAGHADGKILRRIAFPSGKDAHPDEFLPRFYEAIDALLREYNGGAAPAAVAAGLLPRLAVAALVAASLACLSVAAFALLGVGPVASTAVIVLAVAGLVAQMSGAPVPTHMGALAVACGIGTASQLPAQALFAAVTAVVELAVARCALCGTAARHASSTER